MSAAAIARLGSAVRSMVTRATVQQSGVGARVLVQVNALNNETYAVELLHPAGISARPKVGADVVLLQVLGSRDHLVALGGDAVGDSIADLAEGEVGMAAFGCRVVFRTDRLEVTAPSLPVVVTAGNGLTANVTGNAIVTSTTQIEMNAPGDNVTVNGRRVQLI
jgi:phage gp45-like